MLRRGQARALAPLAARCFGLRPIAASCVEVRADGTLRLLPGEPSIEFVPEPAIARGRSFGLLTIDSGPAEADGAAVAARIVVDRSDGFEETAAADFEPAGGRARLVIADLDRLARVRWQPGTDGAAPPRLTLQGVSEFAAVAAFIRAGAPSRDDADKLLPLYRSAFAPGRTRHQRFGSLPPVLAVGNGIGGFGGLGHNYALWLLAHGTLSDDDHRRLAARIDALTTRPRFSFVMPTYDTPVALLRASIEAMLAQTYPDFEICIADDASTDPAVIETIRDHAARDGRVKFVTRPVNGHISAASNSALALATGDFVVLVDHDDLLPAHTLATVALAIAANPRADIFYSDEDKISPEGERSQPYFKGDFDRFLMYGQNMVSHLGVYRRSLVEAIGGFRLGFEGSQDYDLFLRAYERCGDAGVVHIPHILYHWRQIPGSTALSADQKGYAVVAARRAIDAHFERTGMPLRSVPGIAPGLTAVTPAIALRTPVSIIIPTRNGLDVLRPCIRSVLKRPHEAVEIIVVDNGSDDPRTLAWLDRLAADGTATVLRAQGAFDFAAINNLAAAHASGDILCFLNNDTELVSRDWLHRARALLAIPDIGAVGARLLFPDGTLQHCGLVVGMGPHGIAGTPHSGLGGDSAGHFGRARLMQQVSAATAACLFVRKRDFETVGGFEPELRVAYNDVDLCLKLRARGARIVVDPEIALIHKESRTRGRDTTGDRAERLAREAAWMRARWGDVLTRDPFYSPNLDITRDDFAYAPAPRVAPPWAETDATAQ